MVGDDGGPGTVTSATRILAVVVTLFVDASYAQAQAVSCESMSLDPVVPGGIRLLERFYVRSDGIGGLGCWVHPHPNGRDFVLTPFSWGEIPEAGHRAWIDRAIEAIADSRRVLTAIDEPLRSDVPGSTRDWAIWHGDLLAPAWNDLLYGVRTDQTAFEHVFGEGFWEYLDRNPDARENYNRRMTSRSVQEQVGFLDDLDLSGVAKIVDVGGGPCRAFLASTSWP